MNNEEAKWLCFSKPQAPGPFPGCDRLVTSCCLPLTPSQVCSHKQKLFRIHTSWKQRYQHPGCCHEIWECQLTSGAWPGHPAPTEPCSDSLFWGLLNAVSSPLVFLPLPAACLDPLRPGDEQAGPSGPSWRWMMLSGARTGLCWLRCAAELCQGREFAGGLSCEGRKPLLSVMVTTTFWVQEDYLGDAVMPPSPWQGSPRSRLHASHLRNMSTRTLAGQTCLLP